MPINISSFGKKRTVYYAACVMLVVFLASFRSAPVYGKLDFIFLNTRPWWPRWKPMVVDLLQQDSKPIYTDPTTSTVLKGVFNQKTVFARRFYHYPYLEIDRMDSLNKPLRERFPHGAYAILFRHNGNDGPRVDTEFLQNVPNVFLPDFKSEPVESKVESKRLYRCVVNLQGFVPSWVPRETRHWNPRLADTALFYRYHSNGGADLVPRLRRDPPKNCTVYY